ncbi:MAG TPA: META domain-containing protein [Ohtaekwangia sp.]|nr:META domain-containing protein [Ohtaekwangia sp.]
MNLVRLCPVLIGILITLTQCKPTQNTTSVANLENTYWKLSEINGKPVTTAEGVKEVYMVLGKEGSEQRLKGFGGCNNMGGSYTLSGNTIKFIVISTKMACDRMDIENFFFNALSRADRYLIKGETLELYQGETFLTRFESVYLK